MSFPTTEACIEAAEAALAIRFPRPWRDRLLRTNGGEVELAEGTWQVFPVQDVSDRKRAGRTANHLVRETAVARGSHGFPADAVAIADDGFGNYLVLLPAPSGRDLEDQIYFWDHETGQCTAVGPCEALG